MRLTGVATATADGTPMVIIVGNAPSHHHAKEAHHSVRMHADVSHSDIFRPICKRRWGIGQPHWLTELTNVLSRALNLARTGLAAAGKTALAKDVPFLLEDPTRGDETMPRTGYRDSADFPIGGNQLD